MISKKVILLGQFGVGKTSLIRWFVENIFSHDYLTTIGVKVDKKVVNINGTQLSMIIWDIAGERDMNDIRHAYKVGSHGIIYVFDLSRPATQDQVLSDVTQLQQEFPGVPIQVVGNKKDLVEESVIRKLNVRLKALNPIFSSAKTGERVEEFFMELGTAMI
ncbi:MAG: Rab family GTPase [Bacteroidota bacterium]